MKTGLWPLQGKLVRAIAAYLAGSTLFLVLLLLLQAGSGAVGPAAASGPTNDEGGVLSRRVEPVETLSKGRTTNAETADALKNTEPTDLLAAAHPLSANPLPASVNNPSGDHPSVNPLFASANNPSANPPRRSPSDNPLRRRQSADSPSATVTFSCTDVTQIPQAECEALVALYNSTGGSNWRDNTGWLNTSTLCDWYGVTCASGHVTGLDLNGNQLSGGIPPELGSLTNLEGLDLANNELGGGIPPELGNLASLSWLHLNGNQLSGSIPSELGNLVNLQRLDLSSNQLSGALPGSLTNLINLESFRFYNTNLCEPPDTAFQAWLASISGVISTNVICSTEPSVTLTADPDSVPANGTSTSTVTLTSAPAGHRVRLISSRGSVDTFSPASGTTDASGRFVATVRSSTPGTVVITAQDLTTGQTFATSTGVTFTPVGGEPPPPPNEGPVAITDIRSDLPLDGRYLEGVSAPNRIEVSVDWKGTAPGSVDFILNNQTHTVSASSRGADYTLNMGQELQGGTNRLQIVARNAAGATSASVDTAPYLLSKPVWLSGLQSLGAMANFALAGPVTVGREYVSTVRIPPQPIRLGAPGFGPPGSKTELQFYVGGGTKLQLRCDAPLVIEAQAGAEANLDLMGVELGGELKGSGNITAGAMQCEIPTAQGTIRLDIKVYGQKGWPVLTFVVNFISPGAGTALERTLRSVGLYDLMRILGEIYLQANLNGFFQSGAHTVLESPYLEWEGARLGGGPGLEAGYRYKQAILEFKVFLGGKGTAEFTNPDPLRDLTDLDFDRVVLRGEAGYEVRAGWFGDEKRYFVEWAFPSQGQTFVTQARPLQAEPSQWRLLGHGYRKPYAAFHKPPPGKLTPFSPQALGYPPNPPIGGQGGGRHHRRRSAGLQRLHLHRAQPGPQPGR